MAHITLDLTGRLRGFSAIPPQLDTSAAPHEPPDPAPLFAAAGLDLKSFQPAKPEWTPLGAADSRSAWTGKFPDNPTEPIRVEAAWWRGKPVNFQIVGAWTRPDRMVSASGGWRRDYTWIILTVIGGLFAALMAWRNLRLGRGDRQGALRLAALAFGVNLAAFLLRAHYVPTSWSFYMLIEAIGQALWVGALLWLAYIALEPVVRRLWPRSLITWTRVLSGRWRDPLAGRDILIGLLVGMGYVLVFIASKVITLRLGDMPTTAVKLDGLLGYSKALAIVLDRVIDGLLAGFFFFLLFFLFRLILRREWLAGVAFVLFFLGLRVLTEAYPIVDVPAMIIVYGVIVIMLLRCGLLALVTTIAITDLVGELVFTTDFSAWYGAGSLLLVVLVSGLAMFAFRSSLGGQRISAALLDS